MQCEVVSVDEVSFFYNKSSSIIDKFSFRAYSSQILAIVGPSGCGKTTLIKLVLSLLPLDHGSIEIFGRDKDDKNIDIPGVNVGYMPQEEAIPTSMMVKECLYFYAFLNKMNNGIAKRIDQVLRDFELFDHQWSFIFTLSGGMKRRLSLAIALLHQPKLLILDEPSVGADPVLRHKIWRILDRSRRSGQSIIVTTHYVDECRNADNILFMRNGRKLAEASANEIVKKLDVKSLDDAFFVLCSSKKYAREPLQVTSSPTVERRNAVSKSKKPSRLADFLMILAICYQSLHFFLFNPMAFATMTSLWIFPTEITRLAYSDKPYHIPVGLVVENQTIFRDNNLLARLNVTSQCFDYIHPKYFPNYVDSEAINFIEYKNFEDAIDDIKGAKIKAAIYFNEQFGDSFFRRLVSDQSTLEEYTIRNSKILLEADITSRMLYSWIESILLDGYDKYMRGSRANLNLRPIPLYPMEVKDSLVGNIKTGDHSTIISFTLDFVNYTTFSAAISLSGLLSLAVFKDKLLQRHISAGVTPNILFLSQTMVCGGLICLIGYFAIIYALWRNGSTADGCHLLLYVLIFSQSLLGTLLGQVIACLSKSEIVLISVVSGSVLASFPSQGILSPLEAHPYYFQWIAYLLPNTLPLKSVKAINLRKLGIQSPEVFNGFVVGFAYIICLGLISRRGFNKHCTQ